MLPEFAGTGPRAVCAFPRTEVVL